MLWMQLTRFKLLNDGQHIGMRPHIPHIMWPHVHVAHHVLGRTTHVGRAHHRGSPAHERVGRATHVRRVHARREPVKFLLLGNE